MASNAAGRQKVRLQVVLLVVLIVLVAAVGGVLLVQRNPSPPAVRSIAIKTVHPRPPVPATVSAAIEDEVARLSAGSHGDATIYAQGQAVRAFIRQGDFAAADSAIDSMLRRSRVEAWHFHPFADYMFVVSQPAEDAFLQRLDEWVSKEPASAVAYLVRGDYYFNLGWTIRGGRYAALVEPAHMQIFTDDIDHAVADIRRSMELDKTNPYAPFLLLRMLQVQGDDDASQAAFQQAIASFPDYYPLYKQRLYSLEPKWGGSPEAMRQFVDTYAGRVGPYSPLRMLYLELYDGLLGAASDACSGQPAALLQDCVQAGAAELIPSDVEKNAYEALQLYHHADKSEFSEKIDEVLGRMVKISGAERYAGTFLQLTASMMGSDETLVPADASKNNYAADELTGLVWYEQGQYDSAVKLYRRAIADISRAHFETESDRAAALAQVYEDLANLYDVQTDFRQTAVYDKAAEKVYDGTDVAGFSVLTCASLLKLKLYRETVDSCTAQYQSGGGIDALFWRAQAYEGLHKTDLALKDYRIVADSEEDFRVFAAIEMSVIYGHRHDVHNMLDVLNKYDFLYDDPGEDREDKAIAYNNRCFAKMKLGMLESALQDCTQSLQYGNLPDAYAKQQKLIKLLKDKKN